MEPPDPYTDHSSHPAAETPLSPTAAQVPTDRKVKSLTAHVLIRGVRAIRAAVTVIHSGNTLSTAARKLRVPTRHPLR